MGGKVKWFEEGNQGIINKKVYPIDVYTDS